MSTEYRPKRTGKDLGMHDGWQVHASKRLDLAARPEAERFKANTGKGRICSQGLSAWHQGKWGYVTITITALKDGRAGTHTLMRDDRPNWIEGTISGYSDLIDAFEHITGDDIDAAITNGKREATR